MSMRLFVLLLHLVSAAMAQSGAPPAGRAITLDGTIGDEEWRGALSQPLDGGGTLWLMRDGDRLFIGIRGPRDGTAHVCVATENEVRILHVSAAVGEARYERRDGGWRRASGFSWSLRDPALTGPPADARQAYLQQHGWVGTVTRMGRPTDREIILARRDAWATPVRLAAAYVTMSGNELGDVAKWPAINDTCTEQKAVAGFLPDIASFSVERWMRIE